MNLLLLALALTYAALCVGLTVRVINRREKWAKRTLAVVFSLPVLYLLSFGPVCWVASWSDRGIDWGQNVIPRLYDPIISRLQPGSQLTEVTSWYARFGAAEGWNWRTHLALENGAALRTPGSYVIRLRWSWGPLISLLDDDNALSVLIPQD